MNSRTKVRNTETNAHAPGRRNRPGRSAMLRATALASLAATAMLAAACGGNSPSGATGSPQYVKALAFSKCMRSHGALGFPDPTSQGTFTVTEALLHNPEIQAAAPSCKKLLPRGAVQMPAALQRKMDTQALQYAACMRSHGVPNFSDPIIHGGTIGFRVAAQSSGGSGPQSADGASMPQFQSAQRLCQKLLPGSG